MANIPTPHIQCTDPSMIAKVVLMPGDPLRAKYIADNYLTNVVCFNTTRNMLGYTGKYNGKPITVMGSGMGMPSIGIYSYELFNFYDVEAIIRIGSAGSYDEDLKVYDTVLVTEAFSESSYAKVGFGIRSKSLKSNSGLNKKLRNAAQKLGIEMKEAKIHSSDVFYGDDPNHWKELHDKFNCKCVEMESFALFANAKVLGKKAACLLTISDSFITHEVTSAEERQNSFNNMMKIALELAKK
ncbi:MAG: purine-nucleoside phosphorylase [Erysipelotrichaceae bacterium]|nr:purine-nucleoside phosphorylase [Erysipelotrichaceae bacterium]